MHGEKNCISEDALLNGKRAHCVCLEPRMWQRNSVHNLYIYMFVHANSIIMTHDHMMVHLCAMYHYQHRQYKLTPSWIDVWTHKQASATPRASSSLLCHKQTVCDRYVRNAALIHSLQYTTHTAKSALLRTHTLTAPFTTPLPTSTRPCQNAVHVRLHVKTIWIIAWWRTDTSTE